MSYRIISLIFAAVLVAQPAPPAFRLPGDVQPVRYRLELTVVPEQEEFTGTIEIQLRVVRPASVIWLNAADLAVSSARLTAGGAARQGQVIAGGSDFVGVQFSEPLAAGSATLSLEFQGKLNSKSSEGLFRNRIGDDWYAYTQFESTAARRAFPCFDEPAFKTPWQVTLRVKKQHMAFSNTQAAGETELPEGMKAVRFAETRPLPSYLVAMAVGPFETVNGGTAGGRGTPIRIVTPRGRASEAKYAAASTSRVVNLLEEYFGIPYPYGKLDQVAVPLFFGAMENPGMVTYADTLILAPEARDSIQRQRGYVSVAAHELAHQWFGDLVTTKWWNDIWLNEAFATWMGEKITDRFRPDWNVPVGGQNAKSGAMGEDSLVSARRIREPVNSKDDIANAFDGITYQKGAAVIHMFERWVGEGTFRKGVQAYLRKYADGNATADDFLASIGEAAGKNIAPAFSSFLDQPGVPLVTVDLNCGGGAPRLELSQQRSLPLGSAGSAAQTWKIPMCVSYSTTGDRRTRECTLVESAHSSWTLTQAKGCPQWLLANDGEVGYYRTLYRGDLLRRLLADGGKRLTEAERVGLIQEVRDLTEGGQLPVQDALRLAPEFVADPSRHVVTNVMFIAASVNGDVPGELRPNYVRFIAKTFGPKARQLGWKPKPGETDDTQLLRAALVGFVAREGDDAALRDEAKSLALRWIDDRRAVAPELVGQVLNTAAAFGDRALFDKIVAAAKSTQDPRESQALISALGQFRDPEILKSTFGLLLKDDFDLRRTLFLLFGPLNNWKTRDLPFAWVKQNYTALAARLPRAVDSDMSAILPFTASAACDVKAASEAESFFKDKMSSAVGGPRNLAQALESIRLCAAKRQAQQAALAEFLKGY